MYYYHYYHYLITIHFLQYWPPELDFFEHFSPEHTWFWRPNSMSLHSPNQYVGMVRAIKSLVYAEVVVVAVVVVVFTAPSLHIIIIIFFFCGQTPCRSTRQTSTSAWCVPTTKISVNIRSSSSSISS